MLEFYIHKMQIIQLYQFYPSAPRIVELNFLRR